MGAGSHQPANQSAQGALATWVAAPSESRGELCELCENCSCFLGSSEFSVRRRKLLLGERLRRLGFSEAWVRCPMGFNTHPLVTEAIRGLTRHWRTGAGYPLPGCVSPEPDEPFSRRLQPLRNDIALASAIGHRTYASKNPRAEPGAFLCRMSPLPHQIAPRRGGRFLHLNYPAISI
jgi:hypothetical protein